MSKYVLLRIEDDQEADDLLRELATAATPFVRSPRTDDVIHVEVVPGLDAGDEHSSFLPGDPHGLSLETAVGWAYERGPELAAEWEAAS